MSIQTSTGAYVRSDNATGAAYSGTGTGSTAPEQYSVYVPGNVNSSSPILPGNTTIIKSLQTGLYCRLAPLPANTTKLVMLCDQASAAAATNLTYTGVGLSFNGVPLVSTGAGAPLMLANTTSTAPGPSDASLTFPTVGEFNSPAMRMPPSSCDDVTVQYNHVT